MGGEGEVGLADVQVTGEGSLRCCAPLDYLSASVPRIVTWYRGSSVMWLTYTSLAIMPLAKRRQR